MKKVIFIDPWSPMGHINFNRNYVKALRRSNCEVVCVFKKNYAKYIGLTSEDLALELPLFLYKLDKYGGLGFRFGMLLRLIYIRFKLHFTNYDIVMFSSYEEISFFFSGIHHKCYLICHTNLESFHNIIKRFFLKAISKKHRFIVFENYIKEFLKREGINNAIRVEHGLPEPYDNDNEYLRNKYPGYTYYLYSPSLASVDHVLLQNLFQNREFVDFLRKNNILFLVRSHVSHPVLSNICCLTERLSISEYEKYFLSSDIILMPYTLNFNNRVSGIFFECVANNKKCVMRNIEALKTYQDRIAYNAYFENTQSLIEVLNNLLKQENTSNYISYDYVIDVSFLLD